MPSCTGLPSSSVMLMSVTAWLPRLTAVSVNGTPVAAGVPISTSRAISTSTIDSVTGSMAENDLVLPFTS